MQGQVSQDHSGDSEEDQKAVPGSCFVFLSAIIPIGPHAYQKLCFYAIMPVSHNAHHRSKFQNLKTGQ